MNVAELHLLQSAKGGLFTPEGSEEARLAGSFEDRGMLKWVADGVDDDLGPGTFWRLSGEGLTIAFAGEL